MISINMQTPHEIAQEIAGRVKEKRLSLNLSQKTLSKRSGVAYGTLKKFERSGQISLESLLKIALALGSLEAFESLFSKTFDSLPPSIDALFEETARKRGRT